MTAPNIEMISVFLRSCDLGRVGAAHLAEVSDESAGEVTVELNSETALPCHWEQCLDMRSGQVYYINRETGLRTTKDPRTAVATVVATAAASYSSSYQSKQDSSSDDSCSEIGGSDYDEDSVDTANSCLTSLSSTSSTDTAAAAGGSEILVSAGCRSCFMYFMIPKSVDACPKCGSGGFLKLGRHGCV